MGSVDDSAKRFEWRIEHLRQAASDTDLEADIWLALPSTCHQLNQAQSWLWEQKTNGLQPILHHSWFSFFSFFFLFWIIFFFFLFFFIEILDMEKINRKIVVIIAKLYLFNPIFNYCSDNKQPEQRCSRANVSWYSPSLMHFPHCIHLAMQKSQALHSSGPFCLQVSRGQL